MITYDGDPTATQTPGSTPAPGAAPKLNLPADGDPLNVATIYQAFKILADYVAWLFDPKAIASSWAQRIARWRNARGQERFLIDHLGLPSGRFVKWTEDWSGDDAQAVGGSSTFAKTRRPWYATVVNTGGTAGKVEVLGPDASFNPLTKALHLVVSGNTATDLAQAVDAAENMWKTTNSKAVDLDVYMNGVGLTTHFVYFGETEGGAIPVLSGAGFKGAVFVSDAGAWKCVCGDGTNVTVVDPTVGVATGAITSLRIEWWGSGVADDSTNACRFYIDGVLKASITTNLPTNGTAQKIVGAKKVSGSTLWESWVGPFQYEYTY
jgi:hypothetical protein